MCFVMATLIDLAAVWYFVYNLVSSVSPPHFHIGKKQNKYLEGVACLKSQCIKLLAVARSDINIWWLSGNRIAVIYIYIYIYI